MAGAGDVIHDGNFFSISGMSKDYTSEQIFKTNMMVDIKIKRIELKGGTGGKYGTTDKIVIKNGDASGPVITVLATPNPATIDRVYFKDGGQFMRPFIDFSEGYFNIGHKVVFEVA